MLICPKCNDVLMWLRTATRDSRKCNRCGWGGSVWTEDGKRYGKADPIAYNFSPPTGEAA